MKRRQTPEHNLHRWVASYLARALQPPVFWTSIDHGAGKLTKTAAGNAKARGCKAGLPDILIFRPSGSGACVTIGIELKSARGSLSADQKATQGDMMEAGVRCRLARSIDDVERILEAERVPLRARIWGKGIRPRVAA